MKLAKSLRFTLGVLFIALGLLCSGCATVGGVHQVVSVDSNPRGAEVRISTYDDEFVGTTPFFVKLRRRRSHQLEFQFPSAYGGPVRQELTQQCEFRYASVFAGNGPLLLAYLPGEPATVLWYVLGVGLDVLTGAAYNCPLTFFAEMPGQSSQAAAQAEEKRCKKYVIVPPFNEDEKTSDFILDLWVKNSKSLTKGCDTFASFEDARSFFTRIGIDFRSEIDSPDKIEKRHLNDLGYRTSATHLVFLRSTLVENTVNVQTSIYDLHNLKLTLQSDLTLPLQRDAPVYRSNTLKFLSNAMSLLPNSISFGYSQGAFDLHPTEKVRAYKAQTDRDRIPIYFSNWSLSNVEHPNQYAIWDFHLNLEPSLSSFLISKRIPVNLSASAKNQFKDYDLDLFDVVVQGNIRPIIHTPVGAFSVGLGGGAAFIWLDDNTGYSTTGYYWSSSIDITYTAFLTENVFLRLTFGVYNGLFEDIFRTTYFTSKNYTAAGLKLGYYLPEGQTFFRKLF